MDVAKSDVDDEKVATTVIAGIVVKGKLKMNK